MPPTNTQNRVMHGVTANSPLPPSVEAAYYRKCIELKRRINEIEDSNDIIRSRKLRAERAILKLRLERAVLLEEIGKRMEYNPDDSERSDSPPPTPREKPLRAKRQHKKSSPQPAATPLAHAANNADSPPPPGAGDESARRSSSRYARDADTEGVNGGPGSSYPTLAPAPHRPEYDTPYRGSEARNGGLSQENSGDADMADRSPAQHTPSQGTAGAEAGASGGGFTAVVPSAPQRIDRLYLRRHKSDVPRPGLA